MYYRFIYNTTTTCYDGGNWVNNTQLSPNDMLHCLGSDMFFFISVLYSNLYIYYSLRFIYDTTIWTACNDGGICINPNWARTTWLIVWSLWTQVCFFTPISLFQLIYIYIYYRFIYKSTSPWLHAMTGNWAQMMWHIISSHLWLSMFLFLLSIIYTNYISISIDSSKSMMPWLHTTMEVTWLTMANRPKWHDTLFVHVCIIY